jgi:glutamate N-acetyltransferase/amino-acid N-acetyltransferase
MCTDSAKRVVSGAQWSAVASGIKKPLENGELPLDLALLKLDAGSVVSAVFTQNAFCAAPVVVAKQKLQAISRGDNAAPVYCLINAGNANAGTGEGGIAAAHASCDALAKALKCSTAQLLPFSTGVIGEPLPVEKFLASSNALAQGLNKNHWQQAAQAIMTTDTVPKQAQRVVKVGADSITIMGIAKGAGMIKPNMATMLAYIATDAVVEQSALDALLETAVAQSFNRITVDGDTSTNDACLLAATGGSGVALQVGDALWDEFSSAINAVLEELATAIIRDAEGASKFITIDVEAGASSKECLSVAYAVAESPLVKTAFFASDANWGRILAAVGRAGLSQLDINAVALYLNDYCICESGARVKNYDEEKAAAIMADNEIFITIKLGRGSANERVWTSDLSHDYVRINAEYRT